MCATGRHDHRREELVVELSQALTKQPLSALFRRAGAGGLQISEEEIDKAGDSDTPQASLAELIGEPSPIAVQLPNMQSLGSHCYS